MDTNQPSQPTAPQAPDAQQQAPAVQPQAAPQAPQHPPLPIARPPEQIITELRARVNAGQALTRDQVREALAALRQNRMTAAEAAGKTKKSAAPVRSASELLASLKGSQVSG